ncbi:MAG: hypothetical protein OXF84_14830 [Bacteroidetes bacterium]|nr:hypothetical protein [Bacteroidota bacterium]
MTIRHLFVVLTLISITNIIYAQGRDDGSFYSRYGVGELVSFASSQAQALGGASAGLFSYNYMNFSNPGTWSRQTLVRVAIGAQFHRLEALDAVGRSEQFTRGNFNAIQIGVPLIAGKLGMGVSYEPFSRIHYQVSTNNSVSVSPREGEFAYRVNHEGSGGLHQARIGLGFKLTSWASIGATADILFGIIEEGRRTTFERLDLLETNLVNTTRLFGVSSTAGVTLSFDSEEYEFVTTLTATLPTSLDGTRNLTLGESLNVDTLETSTDGTLELPTKLLGGVAFSYQNRWLISTEVRYEPWSSASTTVPLNAFNSTYLRDRVRYSMGVEFIPAGASLQSSYLSRTAYRLGFYRDRLYVSPVPGRDVVVTAITGGLGLPTLFFGTRVDLSFEIGTRGSTNYNLIRDRFIGVSATLNIGERWFVKRRLG